MAARLTAAGRALLTRNELLLPVPINLGGKLGRHGLLLNQFGEPISRHQCDFGLTDYAAKALLAHIVGKTSFTMPTTYIGLYTTVPTSDAGTGGTEVSGGSYARVATSGDWAAASGSQPSSIATNANITFTTATANWGTVQGWGLFDAATVGNLLAFDYLGNFDWLEFTCTSASPGVLTAPAHGYSNADNVVVDAEYGGDSLPTTGGSWAGLLTVANATTDTFTAGVNTTGTGGGSVRKVAQQAVNSGFQFQLNSGNVTLLMA